MFSYDPFNFHVLQTVYLPLTRSQFISIQSLSNCSPELSTKVGEQMIAKSTSVTTME